MEQSYLLSLFRCFEHFMINFGDFEVHNMNQLITSINLKNQALDKNIIKKYAWVGGNLTKCHLYLFSLSL